MFVLLHVCQCSGSFSVARSGLAAWKSLEIQDIVLFLKLGGFGEAWAESVKHILNYSRYSLTVRV